MNRRSSTSLVVLSLVLCWSSNASLARAQSASSLALDRDTRVRGSAIVTGNSNRVSVVNNNQQITIVESPEAESLRPVIDDVLRKHQTELLAALDKKGENTFRDRLLEKTFAELKARADYDARVEAQLSALQNALGQKHLPHKYYVGLQAAGLLLRSPYENAGGFGAGVSFMAAPGSLTSNVRWLVGLSFDGSYLARSEQTIAPNGRQLQSDTAAGLLFLFSVPVEAWINASGTNQLALRVSPMLGPQHTFTQRDAKEKGWAAGVGTAAEYRRKITVRGDYRSWRLGVEWAPTLMSRPRFGFDVFQPSDVMQHEWHHVLRLYVGCLFGHGAQQN